MTVEWVKGKIKPPASDRYYVIYKCKIDFPGSYFKKGECKVYVGYYNVKDDCWASSDDKNKYWALEAWAYIPKPPVPEGLNIRRKRWAQEGNENEQV